MCHLKLNEYRAEHLVAAFSAHNTVCSYPQLIKPYHAPTLPPLVQVKNLGNISDYSFFHPPH